MPQQPGLFSQLQSNLYHAASALVSPKVAAAQRLEPARVRAWDPYAQQSNFREPQFKAVYSVISRFL